MSAISRYRQMLLPSIGTEGQQALAKSTVFVAGCGALGTVAIDLLSRAGVGTLVIADRDVVEETNLQRQTLFVERDAARAIPKAEAAKTRVALANSTVKVRAFVEDIAADTLPELAASCVRLHAARTHDAASCVRDATPPPHRQVSIFKDVCSKTLAIVAVSSHF